jgi:hypothetical protein
MELKIRVSGRERNFSLKKKKEKKSQKQTNKNI